MTRARIYSQSGVGGNVTSNVAANVTLATLIPFLTTSNVTELVNLYFTNARVFANLQLASINAFQDVNTANSANGQALLWDGSSNIWYPGNVISLSTITPFLTTANVTESNSNLYYTNARARTALSPADPTIIIDYSTGTIRANILAVSNASGTSDTVPEGFTNLYFTNARVKTALSLANLVDIGDVTYTGTPSNNQVLTWNSVGGYWTNTTGAAGASASFAETSNVANTVLTLSNFTTYDLAPDPNGVNPYYSNAAVLALFSPGGNTQITTSNIAEGSNLYYTNARVNAMITVAVTDSITPFLTTANVRETSNLYYTNARVLSYVGTLSTSNLAEGSNLYYTNTRVISAVLPYLTTSNVAESTSNLYFTNARVYANIAPLLTTANIIESVSNLYYTNARVNAFIQPWLTTANLLESANSLFYTNARVLANIAVSNIATKFLTVTGNIYATDNVTTSKNLILAKNASAASANGLGIYIDGANASILYNDNTQSLDVNKNIIVTGNILPSTSGVFNLGSPDKKFLSLYLGTQTLFIGNISLGESPRGGLAIQTPNGLPSDASFANITATEAVTLSRFSNVELGLEANGYFGGNVAQFINNKTGNIYYGIKKNDNWGSFAGMRVSETRTIAEPVYPTYTWNVVNSFSDGYVLSGYSSGTDIPLTVTAGDTLVFSVNAPTHPFWIKTSQVTGTGSGVTTGTIIGNGTAVGNVSWNTTGVVPGTYYYICQVHASMGSTITVLADIYPKGNVRSDIIFYNDNEITNNSVARLSLLGNGNNIIFGNVYQDSGSLLYANIVGNVTGRVSTLDNHTTSNLVEGNNLYYTNSRVRSTLSAGTGVSYDSTTGSIAIGQNVSTTATVTFSRVTVTDNLTVYGNVTTYGANNLAISDNMIYLNNDSYNSNPDIGFTFNYNDGTYHHGGFFRDASDGIFKVFENYLPEPDANIFIDTNDASFRLANIQATSFYGNLIGTVSNLSNFTTDSLAEGLNLYYTNARVNSFIQGNLAGKSNVTDLTTANVTELTNLYYTNARVNSFIQGNLATKANVTDLTTSNVVEGTSQYFTNARVLANVSQMSINVFADVDISGIQTNDSLLWNGTSFVAGTLSLDQANTAGLANVANTVLTLSNFTTANLAEGINLYYTNARVISTVIPYLTTSNVIEGANLYYTNARVISGLVGQDISVKDIYAAGNLTVQGEFTTLNVATLNIEDKNITLGKGLTTAAQADGAGISIDGAQANITYLVSGDKLEINKNVKVLGDIQANTWTGLYTSNVIENTNLFYTNARVISAVSPYLTTSNVAEGSNLYYTNSRVYAAIEGNLATKANVSDLNTSNVAEGTNLYYTNARVYSNVIALLPALAGAGIQIQANGQINSNIVLTLATLSPFLTTSNVAEGSNLYYTNARVVSAVTPYLTTANVIETSANLYFTNARVLANVSQMSINVFADVDMTGLQTSGILIWNGSAFVAGTVSAAATSNSALFSNLADRANTAELANVANSVLSISNFTTANLVEGINLYYTNARVVSAVTPYLTTSNVIEGANLYFTNTRAAIGLTGQDISVKDLYAAGNLTVQGDFTTLNVATLNIEDKNITLGKGLTTSAQADSAGITIDGAQANITYLVSGDKFNINKNVEILGDIKANTWTGLYSGNVLESTNQYFTNARAVLAITPYLTTANVLESASNLYYTNARVFANVSEMSVNVFTDVDITGIVNDELLLWNGFDRVFRPSSFSNKLTTANVVELTNLYFTNARVITALSTGTANLSLYNLSTTGVLTVSSGTNDESVAGLEFSNNPAGGAGDTAKIKYFAANIGVNDDTILEISVANNPGDSINFKTMGGGVGVNVARPIAEFDVGGNINARNSLIFSSVVVGPTAQFNAVTANTWNNLYTSNVIEGNNLYYTNARVLSIVTPLLTTSNVIEGSNLYYTNARVYAAIQGNLATKANVVDLTTANVIELNNLYYTNSRVLSIVTPLLTTANVLESSSNLYYTNSRAILAAIPAVTQLTVTTPVFNYNIDQYTGDNPTIYVTAGETISFNLNIGASHPFNIRISNGGTNYDVGLTHVALDGTISTGASAQGKVAGKLFWKVPYVLAGSTYVYQCTNHGSMIGNIVIQRPVGAITTENVTENVNLYYTNARVNSFIQGNLATKANVTDLTTANVSELTNLYYTNARVFANVAQMSVNVFADVDITGVSTGYGLVWDGSKFVTLAPSSSIATANIAIFASSANVANTVLSIDNFTTANLTEGTNLYFTNARVISGLVGQDVSLNNLTVAGDLVVQGNTVTLNTATLIVEDKNILLANGATNSATADGAGFNIAGAQANLTYRSTGDKFEFNKPLDIFGNVKVASAINYANTTNVTKVYQYYNESTQSLDTIFV